MSSLNPLEYLTLEETEKLSENSRGYFVFKDRQHLRYVSATESLCEMLQVPKLKDIIGYSDIDFKWQVGGHTHEYFNRIDNQVMDGHFYTNQRELILVANPNGEIVSRIVEVTKRRVMHNGKCYGLAFEAFDITDKIFPTLNFAQMTHHTQTHEEFSTREISCIRLLLSGHSYHTIAEKLYLSARTIEYHIDKLKHRLKCRNKQELIQKLLKLGFKPYL